MVGGAVEAKSALNESTGESGGRQELARYVLMILAVGEGQSAIGRAHRLQPGSNSSLSAISGWVTAKFMVERRSPSGL